MRFAEIIVLLATCVGCVAAQQMCPTLSVTGPAGVVVPGGEAVFSFKMEGGESLANPWSLEWSVSSGTIAKGQGSDKITVKTAPGGFGTTVTANVKGLPAHCLSAASETSPYCVLAAPSIFDEYPGLAWFDERPRLNAFVVELQRSKNAAGVILLNIKTTRDLPTARLRARLLYNHMRSVDKDFDGYVRIGVDIAGTDKTQIWIVPSGIPTPTCTTRCIWLTDH